MFWEWITRAFLGPLSIYELLNAVGILHDPLTFTWWGLVITCVPVWVVLEISFHWFYKKGKVFPWWSIVTILLSVFFDAVGDRLLFYHTFLWWDQVAHAMGGIAATTWAGVVMMPGLKANHMPAKSQFLFLACFGVTLGVMYEFFEYFSDLIGNSRNLGDGYDTANDLLWDMFGAVTVGALLPELQIKSKYDSRDHSKTTQHS